MAISIGADPEFFLFSKNATSYGSIVQSVKKVPGTKEKPHDLGNGFGVHEDNVLIELTIPPATTPRRFGEYIAEGKNRIEELLGESYNLSVQPSYLFPQYRLNSAQASNFGCEPDYDAYTAGKVRVMQHDPNDRVRCAGGHVHIGGEFNCPPFVAALLADVFISLPLYYPPTRTTACWLLVGGNTNRRRMERYGKPGIFRPKPYGIEYRTPSNSWAQSARTATMLAERVVRLVRYLETTSATKIRESIGKYDWLALQQLLSNPPTRKEQIRDAVDNMLARTNEVFPV